MKLIVIRCTPWPATGKCITEGEQVCSRADVLRLEASSDGDEVLSGKCALNEDPDPRLALHGTSLQALKRPTAAY